MKPMFWGICRFCFARLSTARPFDRKGRKIASGGTNFVSTAIQGKAKWKLENGKQILEIGPLYYLAIRKI